MILISGAESVNQEKRSYGSSFWKTPLRIENTDIPYGRGDEDVCNEVFCCRSNHGIISDNCCFILGGNRFLRELRKSFLMKWKPVRMFR